jgi:type IV pilus assembly protein PilM
MLNNKSFLAVDFGAANLKLAELEVNESGGLLLRRYGFRSLGQDGIQEATRDAAMRKALDELLAEIGSKGRDVNICAPGFHTFSKFVKLPPVDTSKVTQIIQYEAQQNVPFPLEEVVWDYQILGSTPTGELEVLLVAIKEDVVEGLFKTAESSGLRLQIVDVSPAALCNAFRYNYGDIEGCTMLLDIGAKTSNLLFFEKGNVYARGINIGANSITQDFAKESKLAFDDAERIKIAEGFVSLGGAYEEPDSPNQAAISKIARQVMTRLHIQVNQTIQFYRGQQGGSPPDRLFLSGGATSMPYTAQFFSEKLNLPVEYFNPLRNIQLDPDLNREELAKVAHSLGEVVGLGLRNLAHCPVDLNLMPKSSKKRQQFSQKQPYIAAAVFCLIAVVWAFGLFYHRVADEKKGAADKLEAQVLAPQGNVQPLRDELTKLRTAQKEVEHYTGLLEDRWYWGNVCMALREAMISVEDKKEKEFGKPLSVWIEKLSPVAPAGYLSVVTANPAAAAGGDGAPPPSPPPPSGRSRRGGGGSPNPTVVGVGGTEINRIFLTCRGMNMREITGKADANTTLAESVAEEIRAQTNFFIGDPAITRTFGPILNTDTTNLTISFEIDVKLVHPIKL